MTPLLLIFAFAALGAALLLARIFPARLVVSNERTGAVFSALPMRRGETFQLRYTHSVNLSDVTDTIEWTGEQLVCRSTLFTAFGAGIPVLADGIGTDFIQTDEGFVITGINKPETRILVMLQTVPNHRLLWRGQELALMRQYGSGTLLRLVSLREILFHSYRAQAQGRLCATNRAAEFSGAFRSF